MFFFPYNGKIRVAIDSKCVVGDYLREEEEREGIHQVSRFITPEGETLFVGIDLLHSEKKQLISEYFGMLSAEFEVVFPAR